MLHSGVTHVFFASGGGRAKTQLGRKTKFEEDLGSTTTVPLDMTFFNLSGPISRPLFKTGPKVE